jgi:hypothetical protein
MIRFYESFSLIIVFHSLGIGLVKVAESSCPMEKRGCGGVRCTKDQHMPICLALQIILKGQGDRSLRIRIFVGVCMILVAIPSTGQGPLGTHLVLLPPSGPGFPTLFKTDDYHD